MPPALAIALKDLRQRLRDRSAFILFLLAPLLVSGLMAMAFSGNRLHADVGVVDLDGGPAATALTRAFQSQGLGDTVDVRHYRDRSAAGSAVSACTVTGGGVPPSTSRSRVSP